MQMHSELVRQLVAKDQIGYIPKDVALWIDRRLLTVAGAAHISDGQADAMFPV